MISYTSISIRLLTTLAISMTLYLVLTSVRSDRGLVTVRSMQKDIDALSVRSEQITEENKVLRETNWKLTNDPNDPKKIKIIAREIEKIARERYGYLRAGETVFVIEE